MVVAITDATLGAPSVLLGRRTPTGRVRFTVAVVMDMIDKGVLPEDTSIELLNGELVFRDNFDEAGRELQLQGGLPVEGFRHNYVVSRLGKLAVQIDSEARHLRAQSTLVCATNHAPIPDGVILRGPPEAYATRLPTAADVHCVIEVADSSYERDIGEKLTAYARAGVPQYVILNLRNRTAEVYDQPDVTAGTYAGRTILPESATLSLRVAEAETLDVALATLLA